MGILDNGYCYKIGNIETIIYDEIINNLSEDYGNCIELSQIEYAINQLRKYGMTYWATIDRLSLLLYYMDKENVTIAISHKQ